MDKSEWKWREKRLKKLGGKRWKSLSLAKQEAMVQRYGEIARNTRTSIPEIIIDASDRAKDAALLFLGLILGVFGGMAGNILNDYLIKYDPTYSFLVILGFVIVIILLVRFPEILWHSIARESPLFDKLLGITENADLPDK
jgi:hypothetical protein